GTGYQSFWLGSRLDWVWERAGGVNEAHNGYLEMYLNLGLIGVFLVAAFLIASYRSICTKFKNGSEFGSFCLAIWTVLVCYNMTESALPTGLLWTMLLPGALTLTQSTSAAVGHGTSVHGVLHRRAVFDTPR